MLFCSCYSGEIEITTDQNDLNKYLYADGVSIPEYSNTDYSVPDEAIDVIKSNPTIGDKIFFEGNLMRCGTGEMYFTINKATVCKSLSEANISYEDLLDCYIVSLDDPKVWDADRNFFTDDYAFIMIDMTVENVNATSCLYSNELLANKGDFGEYDFSIDLLGNCGSPVYYDKSISFSHNWYVFHLESGQSVDLKCGYIVYLKDKPLKDVTFKTESSQVEYDDDEVDLRINIDLNLG